MRLNPAFALLKELLRILDLCLAGTSIIFKFQVMNIAVFLGSKASHWLHQAILDLMGYCPQSCLLSALGGVWLLYYCAFLGGTQKTSRTVNSGINRNKLGHLNVSKYAIQPNQQDLSLPKMESCWNPRGNLNSETKIKRQGEAFKTGRL